MLIKFVLRHLAVYIFAHYTDDMLYFYTSVIRPILEYACPEWHTSLTKEQTKQIEVIQKRALRIIFSTNCINYKFFAKSIICRH